MNTRLLIAAAVASAMAMLAPGVATAASWGPRTLTVTSKGDGDSWKASNGKEYRLALVNTPESYECFGREASDRRRELTAGGFLLARITNRSAAYGRTTGLIATPSGEDIGKTLAREGLANDKYTDMFRREAPDYAAELDVIFDEARSAGRGLWGSCPIEAEERAKAFRAIVVAITQRQKVAAEAARVEAARRAAEALAAQVAQEAQTRATQERATPVKPPSGRAPEPRAKPAAATEPAPTRTRNSSGDDPRYDGYTGPRCYGQGGSYDEKGRRYRKC